MTVTHFYSGGWKTTVKHKKAQITAQPLVTNKVFKIGTTTDNQKNENPAKFRVIADGEVLFFPVAENGSVLVEAKEISIEQVNEGTFFTGSWEVIQEPQLSQVAVDWVIPAKEGEVATLASFKTETEAVLTFGFSTQPPSPEVDSLIKIFVDGKVLKTRDGVDLTICQGSSIILRGKIIGVQVFQGLPVEMNFGGKLKIVAKNG
jgi:hypothetical protein